MAKKTINSTAQKNTRITQPMGNAVSADGQSRGKLSVKFFVIVLTLVSFVLYANTLQNGYVLDDATVITNNTIVTKGFKGIPELLVTSRLKGFEQANNNESYRPIPLITHAIEYQLFGTNPSENHFFNIILFIGCVIALFLFLDKLLNHKKTEMAFLASLLFAAHPIHTEVVANIKSRDELLSFLFAFTALNVFIKYTRQGKFSQLLAGAVALFLSYLSKETTITFLFIIPFIFFFYARENRKLVFYIVGATLVVTLSYLALRAVVLGAHYGNQVIFLSNPLVSAPKFSSRLATAIMVLGMCLKLLMVPYPLVCDYSYNSIPLVGFGNISVLISMVIYLSFVIIAFYRLVKDGKDPWSFSILFFLISIGLFSNIPFLVYSEMAERFLFFASAGFCLAAALAYESWVTKKGTAEFSFGKNKAAAVVAILICVVFSGLTILRNTDWKDNYTLFSADLKKSMNNAELNFYLGSEISQNMYPQETNPLRKQLMDNESINYLNKAISIYPDFDQAHAELGRIYDRLQIFDSAIVHDRKAVAINPSNSIAAYNLARAYYFLKEYPEAIASFKKIVSINPDFTLGYVNLARCFSDYGRYDSAILYFNKALFIDPDLELAKQGLAKALLMNSKDSSEKTR